MKQNSFRSLFFSVTTLLGSVSMLQAHPGHGPADSSAAHLLTSPDHLIAFVLTGIALGAAAVYMRKRAGTAARSGMVGRARCDKAGKARPGAWKH